MDYYQLLTSAAFSMVGVVSFIIAYFIFNLITPFDFSREL